MDRLIKMLESELLRMRVRAENSHRRAFEEQTRADLMDEEIAILEVRIRELSENSDGAGEIRN